MEVPNKRSAMLSNMEVLSILNEYADEQKQSKNKNSRNNQNLSTITYEAIKYLADTPAALQDQEIVESTLKSLMPYGLTKAEKLQLLNLRPVTAVEISLIVEESEERITEEQIDEIIEIVSKLPSREEEEMDKTEET